MLGHLYSLALCISIYVALRYSASYRRKSLENIGEEDTIRLIRLLRNCSIFLGVMLIIRLLWE